MGIAKLVPTIITILMCCTACSTATAFYTATPNEMVVIPAEPDYNNPDMWITMDDDKNNTGADIFYVVSTWEEDWTNNKGMTAHYADVWNPTHREHMAIEINRIKQYMAPGNRFYAPFYRHATINAFLTKNERVIKQRTQQAMNDVLQAFDFFISKRDNNRPLIIAGFSQGAMAVLQILKHMDDNTYKHLVAAYVLGYKLTKDDITNGTHIKPAQGELDTGVTICYNTVKDVKFIQPIIAQSVAAINPVNWKTDNTPATLNDSITVTLSTKHHVLVVKGYSGDEYPPYGNFINVGDIHGCEPWLYSKCLQENINKRTQQWRTRKSE
jgi:hypothetical protein